MQKHIFILILFYLLINVSFSLLFGSKDVANSMRGRRHCGSGGGCGEGGGGHGGGGGGGGGETKVITLSCGGSSGGGG
ncbi:hypothetical protein Mgra_00004548, partial [Meloidogyne graminicola]